MTYTPEELKMIGEFFGLDKQPKGKKSSSKSSITNMVVEEPFDIETLTGEELISFYFSNYNGATQAQLKKRNPALYQQIVEQDLTFDCFGERNYTNKTLTPFRIFPKINQSKKYAINYFTNYSNKLKN